MSIEFLSKHPISTGLTDAEVTRLDGEMQDVRFAGGDALFEEGEPAPGLFCILRGSTRVEKRGPDGRARTLTELSPPTILGEMELILSGGSNATVIAEEDVEGRILPNTAFNALVDAGDPLATKLMRNIARVSMARMRETNERFVSMLEPKKVPEFEAFKNRLLNDWSF